VTTQPPRNPVLDKVLRQRRQFDPVGHYARADVFTLTVNNREQHPVRFDAGGP